jgi:hypothetical protein
VDDGGFLIAVQKSTVPSTMHGCAVKSGQSTLLRVALHIERSSLIELVREGVPSASSSPA